MRKGDKSESTQRMIEQFCELRFELGLGIKEIAERTQVSYSCVYDHLDEIGALNGYTREELLEEPGRSGERQRYGKRLRIVEPLDLAEVKSMTKEAVSSVQRIIDAIDETLKRENAKNGGYYE